MCSHRSHTGVKEMDQPQRKRFSSQGDKIVIDFGVGSQPVPASKQSIRVQQRKTLNDSVNQRLEATRVSALQQYGNRGDG